MNGISVIIPAYNEEKRIGEALKCVIEYFESGNIQYEIIIIDDCSTDNTPNIIGEIKNNNTWLYRHEINKGKGAAVKTGISKAKYDLVLFTDADLATPIKEVKKLMDKMLNGCDIVIASRNMSDSNIIIKQPFYRQLMGRIFPLFVNLLVLPGFKDTQCGFKLFKTNVAKILIKHQKIDRFCFDVELLYMAKKLGYTIKEVGVIWLDHRDSTVNPIKDGYKMFKDLLKIKKNHKNLR